MTVKVCLRTPQTISGRTVRSLASNKFEIISKEAVMK